jgi:hypothetical protein
MAAESVFQDLVLVCRSLANRRSRFVKDFRRASARGWDSHYDATACLGDPSRDESPETHGNSPGLRAPRLTERHSRRALCATSRTGTHKTDPKITMSRRSMGKHPNGTTNLNRPNSGPATSCTSSTNASSPRSTAPGHAIETAYPKQETFGETKSSKFCGPRGRPQFGVRQASSRSSIDL